MSREYQPIVHVGSTIPIPIDAILIENFDSLQNWTFTGLGNALQERSDQVYLTTPYSLHLKTRTDTQNIGDQVYGWRCGTRPSTKFLRSICSFRREGGNAIRTFGTVVGRVGAQTQDMRFTIKYTDSNKELAILKADGNYEVIDAEAVRPGPDAWGIIELIIDVVNRKYKLLNWCGKDYDVSAYGGEKCDVGDASGGTVIDISVETETAAYSGVYVDKMIITRGD